MTFDEAITILNYLIFTSDGAVEARRMAVAALSNGDDLKPCPFCGGEAEVTDEDSYGFSDGDWFVCCTECHTYLGFDSQYETPQEAIEAWNARVDE